MAVIGVNKTKDYTVMSNCALRDKRLSLKAKGLIAQMLSLPEDWDYSIAGLAAINKEADNTIKTALDELKAAGYLVVTKKLPNETDTGRIEYEYDLYEVPHDQKQEGEKQGTEKQGLEIQGLEIQTLENCDNKIKNNKVKTNQIKNNEVRIIDKAAGAILDSVPVIANNETLRDTFVDFIKMRKAIKKPLTERGLKLAINEAYKLGAGDPGQMEAILEQSILNSWQGLFPLKNNQARTSGGNNSALAQLEALAAEEGVAL